MFLDYYDLRELPFGVTPDPRFYYASRSHREALACLTYAVECRSGFAALVAEPGMGKTMLLRRLLQTFEQRARTAFLLDTDASVQPLPAILTEFGLTTEGTDRLAWCTKLKEIIIQENRAGRFVLLIIDEAQNLDGAALESIRLLSNFETDETKLLQIVLGGQPRLAEKLCTADLRQLHQRIPIGGSLQPLDRAETELYVAHRLKVAGHSGPPLFTAEALDMITGESAGIPRQINCLCFNALSLACALRKRQADADTMREVLHDFHWAQRIVAQQQAAAQQKTPRVEAPYQITSMPSQVQRAQSVQAAGNDARVAKTGNNRVAVAVAPSPRRGAAIAGLVVPRQPANALQQVQKATSFGAVAARTAVPARTPLKQPRVPDRRQHPALVACAGAMVMLILLLLARQTDSGSALMTWASAQVTSALKTKGPNAGGTHAITAPQPKSSAKPIPAGSDDGRALRTSKLTVPASSPAALGHRAATSALDAEQNATSHEDATDVVVRHPRKLANSVSDRGTRVMLEPDTAPVVPAHSAAELETRPDPIPGAADARAAAPVLARVPATPRVSSGAIPAVAMSRFVPGYPEIASRWGMQGMVLLEAVVDKQGRVKQIRPISGPVLLVDIATKAVRQWRYQPAMLNGEPIESTVEVSIRFELTGSN